MSNGDQICPVELYAFKSNILLSVYAIKSVRLYHEISYHGPLFLNTHRISSSDSSSDGKSPSSTDRCSSATIYREPFLATSVISCPVQENDADV